MATKNKLLTRLRQLYALAIVKPEEEGDSGRQEEARNAAFLLIKTAREGGVKLKFEVPKARAPEPPPAPPVPRTPMRGVAVDVTMSGDMPFPHHVDARDAGELDAVTMQELNDFMNAVRASAHSNAAANARATGHTHSTSRSDFFRAAEAPKRGGAKACLSQAALPGSCIFCGMHYRAQERVWWVPGIGSTHERCGPDVFTARAP